MNSLRNFIAASLIRENINVTIDSIDDQIDSILLGFEDRAIIKDEPEKDMNFEGLIDLRPLVEADEEDSETGEAEPEEEKPADKDDLEADQPLDPPAPMIDVSMFVKDVARLAGKFEHMIDIPTVIAVRAYNYLIANYDQNVANEFKDMIAKYGFEIEQHHDTEPRVLPIAVGAAASAL